MASRVGNPYEAWDKMVLLTNQDVGILGDLPLASEEKIPTKPKKKRVEESTSSLFHGTLYQQCKTGAETYQQICLKNSKGNPEKSQQQNSEKLQDKEKFHLNILQKDFKQQYFEQSNEKKPFEVMEKTVSGEMKKRSDHHGEKYTRKQRSEMIGMNQIKTETNSEKGLKELDPFPVNYFPPEFYYRPKLKQFFKVNREVAVQNMDSAEPENADKIVKGKKHRKYLFFKRNI